MQPADIIIEHGTVLTMDRDNRIIDDGAVAIAGQRIVEVGTTPTVQERFAAAQVIDARHMVVMPGLVDTYGHAGHGLIKAIYHPQLGWPTNLIYFHATTPEWWYAEGMLSTLERLKCGVTCGFSVIGATPARMDSPIFAQRQAEAAVALGVRAVLGVGPPDPFVPHLPVPWTATRWENGQPREHTFTHEQTIQNTETLIREWQGASEGRIQVAIHYPYLFGRQAAHPRFPFVYESSHIPIVLEKACEIAALAKRHSVLVHSHLFRGAVDFAVEHFGLARTESLLDDRTVFAHCNGLGETEIDLLGANGVNIASVPFTHENLWYGVCPTIDLLQAGANVTIATDGTAPYTSYDLLRELSRAIWAQWSHQGDQSVLPPGKALRMVTIDAARALHLDQEIGSLEVGKRADLILINLAQPHLTPPIDIVRLICFYANGADVDTVLVDGKILMRNRKVLGVDEQAILAQAREQAQATFAHVDVSPYLTMDQSFWQGWQSPMPEM